MQYTNKALMIFLIIAIVVLAGALLSACGTQPLPVSSSVAVSQLQCQLCHGHAHAMWKGSPHAHTQTDVASELGEERAGQTPDDVIHGEDAEDCIACHGPTAILADGGMNETQTLTYFFFTTSGGKFTPETTAINADSWPDITCTSCHNVPKDHPKTLPILSFFNSQHGDYAPVGNVSELCGQCHGNLLFPDTDHLTYNDWKESQHAKTQEDVATELGEERAGQTPDEVINGEDAEDCITCHGPTAVLANGGMTVPETLDYFFTTTNGEFTSDTSVSHSDQWPDVSCLACHDQHRPQRPAFFNPVTKEHERMANASELCGQCHGSLRFPDTDHLTYDDWKASKHAKTQEDVATELGEERAGQTPDEVINGEDAEDCITCHGPTAVLANGGMTVPETLDYFFTTTNGEFTSDTSVSHSDQWPDVSCLACHDQHRPQRPAFFNPVTKEHERMANASELCGQCHGSLRFPDTDHLTYDAWLTSTHAITQDDVASELGEERAGQTPDEVVNGEDAEDCIACHAPTAVLANGGMSASEALAYFFTTADGQFTGDVASAHQSEWPDVSCLACHDQHNPDSPAYFNSDTKAYEPMAESATLCGQCHGDLRFPDTDHLSYNILTGTGGIGVPDLQTEPGATCTDCHMFVSDEDGSNSSMYHGHSWAITVQEADGKSTVSCTQCHAEIDTAEKADDIIKNWQSEFEDLDATAQKNVAAATDAMQGVQDEALQSKLEEAQHNLTYAESDESGGYHNHNYLMSLLEDANNKALEILATLQ